MGKLLLRTMVVFLFKTDGALVFLTSIHRKNTITTITTLCLGIVLIYIVGFGKSGRTYTAFLVYLYLNAWIYAKNILVKKLIRIAQRVLCFNNFWFGTKKGKTNSYFSCQEHSVVYVI